MYGGLLLNLRCVYRSVNAIFGKIGRIASEEVVLQLIKSKRLYLGLLGVPEKLHKVCCVFNFEPFLLRCLHESIRAGM